MSKEKKKSKVELFPLPVTLLELDEDGEGKGIFYFHEPGDYLCGTLIGKGTHKTIHYPLRTYILKPVFEARQDGRDMIIKDDQTVEFPRNIKLRRIIEDHYDDILGKPIRVMYQGKRGRYKKYSVAEVKGMGILVKPRQEQKDEKKHKKKAKRKGVNHAKARRRSTSKRSGQTARS